MECGSPALQADSLLYEPAVNYWTVKKFACTLDGAPSSQGDGAWGAHIPLGDPWTKALLTPHTLGQ